MALKPLLFISLLCIVAALNDDDGIFPGPNVTSSENPITVSPSPKPTTPTQPPTTKPTTPSTTTTTVKPTPTPTTTKPTTPSTTTTAKPTPAPTTTKPTTPTTTTTAKPTPSPTTTTKPTTPSTTVKPTPAPTPIGKWAVNYTLSNRTCLVLEAQLDIDVHVKDGNTTKNFTVNVPATATSSGVCGPNDESLTLAFGGIPNTVNFNLKKSSDNKTYDVVSVIIMLNHTVPGVNTTYWVLAHSKDAFVTPIKNSYKCVKNQSLDLTPQGNDKNYEGVLRISHFQVQAFKNATNRNFDEALDCAASETPDAVPIAVGCTLAALVIVVLIAYLIGRRRSQARGYLSM